MGYVVLGIEVISLLLSCRILHQMHLLDKTISLRKEIYYPDLDLVVEECEEEHSDPPNKGQ